MLGRWPGRVLTSPGRELCCGSSCFQHGRLSSSSCPEARQHMDFLFLLCFPTRSQPCSSSPGVFFVLMLPDPPEYSPCSQRMTRVILASCQSVKCIFCVCSFALRELLAKSVTSPVWSCRKSEFFPLSRCLAFAPQVVGAAVGKGMCSFPRSGEMLLFYSDKSCREQSRYRFCLALASPLRCFQPWGSLLKMWKGCGYKTDPEIWARQAIRKSLSFSN